MADEARRHLKTLGLEPGASVAEIKQAYRELARVWHPDRFANAPQLRDRAQAKMAEINTAYHFLKRAMPDNRTTSSGTPASSSAPPASPATPNTQHNRRANAPPQSAQNRQNQQADSSWRAFYSAYQNTNPHGGSNASAPNTAAPSGSESTRGRQGFTAPNVPLLAIGRVFYDPVQPVTNIAFSPDGYAILAASGSGIFWWSAETGEKLRELRVEKGHCPCLAVSPNGRSLVFAVNLIGWLGKWRSELRMCDLQTGAEQQRIRVDGHVTSLAWSLDGNQIAAGNTNGIARFWDADTEREIQRLLPDENTDAVSDDAQVRRVAYVDGPYAAKQAMVLRVGQALSEIGLWEVRRARLLKAYSLHIRECLTYGQIGDVLPSPDGNLLLVVNNDPGNRNYSLHLWDVKTGLEVRAMRGHESAIQGVAWSVDGQRVASCGMDKTTRVWEVATGTQQARGLGHTRPVRAVTFAPDGKILASGGLDGSVCLWRLPL